jgi:hypothetical protein
VIQWINSAKKWKLKTYQTGVEEDVQVVWDQSDEQPVHTFVLEGLVDDAEDTSVVDSVQTLVWELVHDSGSDVVQRKGDDGTPDGGNDQSSDWVDEDVSESVVHVLLDLVVWVDHD